MQTVVLEIHDVVLDPPPQRRIRKKSQILLNKKHFWSKNINYSRRELQKISILTNERKLDEAQHF